MISMSSLARKAMVCLKLKSNAANEDWIMANIANIANLSMSRPFYFAYTKNEGVLMGPESAGASWKRCAQVETIVLCRSAAQASSIIPGLYSSTIQPNTRCLTY